MPEDAPTTHDDGIHRPVLHRQPKTLVSAVAGTGRTTRRVGSGAARRRRQRAPRSRALPLPAAVAMGHAMSSLLTSSATGAGGAQNQRVASRLRDLVSSMTSTQLQAMVADWVWAKAMMVEVCSLHTAHTRRSRMSKDCTMADSEDV